MMNIPKKFFIGTSSSAWQIEGNFGKISNQKSWADLFYEANPNLWVNQVGPEKASDFYNHYEEDIKAMADHGMNAFRFTIQWARFMQDPLNSVISEEGVDFYNRVLDCIIDNGMEPIISLEHWDIPAILFDKYEGWVGLETVVLYEKYAQAVMKEYHDRVKYWFAFTEPNIPIDNGYLDGIWYPFKHDPKSAYQAHFHKILATAKAVKIAKSYEKDGCKMGAMIHLTPIYARSSSQKDLLAAKYADLLQVRIYLDTYLKGEFPDELIEILKEQNCMFEYTDEDLIEISQNTIQMLGVDYYYPIRVMARTEPFENKVFHPEFYYEAWVKPDREINADRGWEIYPQAILDFGERIKNEYDNFPWFISENGIGIANEGRFRNENGIIEDDYRIDFIKRHLICALQSKENGSSCFGYLIWSFVDNVSALNAFKNRYGLLELDTDSYERRPKKSLLWLKETTNAGKI